MTLGTLIEICRRADLEISATADRPLPVAARYARWPHRTFEVTIDDDESLVRALNRAASDVEDLWPGRDREEGALTLLSTSLRAALDSRQTAPRTVTFDGSGLWVTTPQEETPGSGSRRTERRWMAPRRTGAAG